ncbi:enoyl-CoA-hydratase DpgB [Dactylosporangium sp. NPDC051485]|uniref:enoyl-CoA-hydratase DpgB n=1 Tax=Dactylosporangium sp. NPDC051485 TaxID=3154846 RepID=UPI0034222169
MDTELRPGTEPGALGLQLTVAGGQSLPALTTAVNDLRRRAEQQTAAPVLTLRLNTTGQSGRGWPGPVGIQDINRWERALRGLERCGAVSLAVAGGTCVGPALDLLLVADYRICAADLRLLLPVNDGQMWPGMALHRLAQQLGLARARQLVLWGTDLTAETALRDGLVDEIAADLDDAAAVAVVWLGRTAAPELAVRRALLHDAGHTGHDDALGAHLAACDRELRRLRSAAGGQ